jgi:uncharacterized repeat protein (TIGR01451 family)
MSLSNCLNQFTITRTYRATDACGNVSFCAQTIRVNDTIAPVITCPSNVLVSCAAQIPPVDTASATASDNCAGTVLITHDGDVMSASNCLNRFTIQRTYRATDVCGNSSTCVQTIVVNDTNAPSILCPSNLVVTCAAQVPAPDTGLVTASDLCGGTVIVAHVGDVMSLSNCLNQFTITRTYRATDACGNVSFCAQTIRVNDTIAPAILCPSNITVTCASDVPAPDTGEVFGADGCSGVVLVTHVSDVMSGSNCLNRFTVTRRYRATDACGNVSFCMQTITVNDTNVLSADTIPPQMVCPGVTVAFRTMGHGGCNETIRYQWFKDGAAIAGATNGTLVLTNVTPFSGGDYSVIVFGACRSVTNSTVLTVNTPTPNLAVATVCPAEATTPGGILTFTGYVTNTGNISLTNVVVTNDQLGNAVIFGPTNLAPGQVGSFTVSRPVPLLDCVPWTDVLTASGRSLCGTPVSLAYTSVCASASQPAIAVLKVCPVEPVAPGGVLTFAGFIVNIGKVRLTNVVVLNDRPAPNTVVYGPVSLDPDEAHGFTGSYTVPADECGPWIDTLTVTARSICGLTVSDNDTAVCPANLAPSIQLTKECPAAPVAAGSVLTYTGTVRNTGTMSVTNVAVVVNRPVPNTMLLSGVSLAPGQSRAFTNSYLIPADSCAPVADTLTASARSICGVGVTNSLTAACQVANSGRIAVTKSCPELPVAPGGVLTFSGSVSNAGNVPLLNVVVLNDQPTNGTPVYTTAVLLPGEVRFFSGSYRTPATSCGPWTDTLTARAVTACGGTPSATATATCARGATPDLVVTQECPPQPTPLGALLVYSGVVSNSGNTTLTNVYVTSNRPTNGSPVLGPVTLAPGEWRRFTNSYQLPQHADSPRHRSLHRDEHCPDADDELRSACRTRHPDYAFLSGWAADARPAVVVQRCGPEFRCRDPEQRGGACGRRQRDLHHWRAVAGRMVGLRGFPVDHAMHRTANEPGHGHGPEHPHRPGGDEQHRVRVDLPGGPGAGGFDADGCRRRLRVQLQDGPGRCLHD